MRSVPILAVGFAAIAAAALAADSGAPRINGAPLSSIQEIMDSVIDPSADVLWGASGTVVDKDQGIVDLTPKTDEAWHDVRRAAIRIIEGGNLLMMPGRQGAPPGSKSQAPGVELEGPEVTALIVKNRQTFNTFARALQAAGIDALQAIDAKNSASLMEAGARMDGICESCHQTFWYPSVLAPQAGGQPSNPR